MKFRKMLWMITIMMTLVFAACSGEAVTPTADSSGSADNTLSQNVTFEGGILGGGFSVTFPDGWSHQLGESDIRLSNNADIINLESEPETLPAGTIAMSVSLVPATDAQGIANVTSLVQTFVDFAQSSSTAPEYGDIETITLNGSEVAKAVGTIAGSDNLILALDMDGNIVLAIIVTPEGELDNHMDTINAIIASVELSPAE